MIESCFLADLVHRTLLDLTHSKCVLGSGDLHPQTFADLKKSAMNMSCHIVHTPIRASEKGISPQLRILQPQKFTRATQIKIFRSGGKYRPGADIEDRPRREPLDCNLDLIVILAP
jgi:hypothetical protein